MCTAGLGVFGCFRDMYTPVPCYISWGKNPGADVTAKTQTWLEEQHLEPLCCSHQNILADETMQAHAAIAWENPEGMCLL
jgi:hypothetical protein